MAVCEILRMTGRARDMIMDPEQTGRLPEVIKEGSYYGMQTFDQALLASTRRDVSAGGRDAVCTSPHDFKLLVAAEGRTATSMDDLDDAAGGPLGQAGDPELRTSDDGRPPPGCDAGPAPDLGRRTVHAAARGRIAECPPAGRSGPPPTTLPCPCFSS